MKTNREMAEMLQDANVRVESIVYVAAEDGDRVFSQLEDILDSIEDEDDFLLVGEADFDETLRRLLRSKTEAWEIVEHLHCTNPGFFIEVLVQRPYNVSFDKDTGEARSWDLGGTYIPKVLYGHDLQEVLVGAVKWAEGEIQEVIDDARKEQGVRESEGTTGTGEGR